MQFPADVGIPFARGDFAVSGSTTHRLPSPHVCGATHDELGNLVVYLLEPNGPPAFADELAKRVGGWLTHVPALHDFLRHVQRLGAALGATDSAPRLAVLRLSHADSCVEVLNAGLPPIVEMGPRGARVFAGHEADASSDQPSYPYELLPLVWNTTWLLLAGAAPDERSSASMLALAAGLDLELSGRQLSRTPPGEWPRLPVQAAGACTVLAVSAIVPTRRPPSGE